MTGSNRRVFLRNSALAVGAAATVGHDLVVKTVYPQAARALRPAVSQRATYLWPAARVPMVT